MNHQKVVRRVDDDTFEKMLNRWGKLSPQMRQEVRKDCLTYGHRWVEPPFSTPEKPVHACRRCIQYQDLDPHAMPPTPDNTTTGRIHPNWSDPAKTIIKRWRDSGSPVEPKQAA